MTPSVDVLYTDVWTDTTAATANPAIKYQYIGLTTTAPTDKNCVKAWGAACRIVINYPQHIQAIWDYARQTKDATGAVISDHTCSQAGCHNTTDAKGANQVPASQLDLTNTPSNAEPLQFVSYQQLLFPHDKLQLIMGALQPVPGPPDAAGNPTTVQVGPYLNAGSANGGASAQFLSRFATGSGSTHAGWLSPAELRLLSEWLDIGAQYFNNPFDPMVPVN
jgi:hypothetical protein